MRKATIAMLAGVLLGIGVGCTFYFTPIKFLSFSLETSAAKFALGIGLVLLTFCLLWLWRGIYVRSRIDRLRDEKKEYEVKLHEYQTRFDTVFRQTNIGIALLQLDGRLLRANQALCELLGYSEDDMLRVNFYYLIHPNDLNNLQIHIQNLMDHKIKFYQSEQQCFRKNGDVLWVVTILSLIRDINDNPLYFIVQVQNITLQKKAEERLRHMAYHDPLTSLANRNQLEQFITHILATARRHQQEFALMFLDMDRFKNINDTIGHEAGDMLLQVVAERLRGAVRTTDLVARLGGDEFVLVITDVKQAESVALIAQKILDSVLKVIVIKGQELYITTSIGISLYPHDGQNMQALMKNADLALYRAKEHGRNNYQFYTSEMTSHAQEKMSLQNALGHALVKNEFLLHYQPKMDIKTRTIIGVEAFLRWKNEAYGTITPGEIIALAEETGLIILVSEWVLKTACQQLKKWRSEGHLDLTIAVNCSARQFRQTSFADDILKIINEVGIPPELLEIEVTESTIMQDPENTLRILYALKDLGIKIAIDDFGTGYWSLANLRRLSVDRIKIDKTFIKQVTSDETSAIITRAIIAMANKLGIKSIAEGVENREQYDFLVKEGCTEVQGYYLTQPLSDEAMTRFLKHPIPDAEAISKDELAT